MLFFQVDLAMIYGDRNRAVKASVKAKNYSILSIYLGILIALAIAMYHLIWYGNISDFLNNMSEFDLVI